MGATKDDNELVGARLAGKWRVDALLGRGGMATVYAATHRNGRRAALKVLHRDLAADADLCAHFLREGYVANRVGHAGVCSVLDDDRDGERVFLVLELLEGESLRDRWVRAGKRLPYGDVLAIAADVLDVLAAAHGRGIVHRDVKPENVWLSAQGGARLLDFGIARLHEVVAPPSSRAPESSDLVTQPLPASAGSRDAARADATLGTPAFMAPEQARGCFDDIDGRTDVYGVAATMFTLLTGQYVHARDGSTALFVAAATERARSIREVMPELSPEFVSLLDRALAFEPAARPDATSMRAGLLACMVSSQPERSAPESRTRPRPESIAPVAASMPPPARRSPRWAPAVASVGVAGALALVVLGIRSFTAVSTAPRASAATQHEASAAARPPAPSVLRLPSPVAAPLAASAYAPASAAASANPRVQRKRGGDGLTELR